MEESSERPIIRAALVVSALMLVWMGRGMALGEIPVTGDLLRADYQMMEGYVGLVPVRHLGYHTEPTLRLARVRVRSSSRHGRHRSR